MPTPSEDGASADPAPASTENRATVVSNVDRHVGRRLRTLRRERGLTQTQLGRIVGVSFQQIQKFEKGVNRIAAGRLWDLSGALGVEIGWFFETLDAAPGDASEANARRPAD